MNKTKQALLHEDSDPDPSGERSPLQREEAEIEREIEDGFQQHMAAEVDNQDDAESEFVEDEDTEIYEEPQTGINFSYVLSEDEIEKCLKHGISHRKNTLYDRVAFSLFMFIGLLSVVFGVKFEKPALFCITAGCVMGAVILSLLPWFFVKRNASRLASTHEFDVDVFADEIKISRDGTLWSIPLDNTCDCDEVDDMMLIYLPGGRIFIIPMRAIDPDFLPDVQAMLLVGTDPKE